MPRAGTRKPACFRTVVPSLQTVNRLKPTTSLLYITVILLASVGKMTLASPFQAPVGTFDSVSERAMRANLRFFASDELKGRDTPSWELDIAAQWIASQFDQAGLEPVAKDGYFQSATFRDKPVRNVVGLVRGSDPVLANTFLIVSAHYDHLGQRGTEGDTIFNGANDNGSGVIALVELAKCFGAMKTKPKRSILFIAFWGEEKGLQGARHYAQNPMAPLAKTVGMVNLEQLGRTDDVEGPQVSRFAITGFDLSSLPASLAESAKKAGVAVDSRPQGDPYFAASDNAALAAAGVPAHTASVSYAFPDYHRATDHWDKIDYANLAKVVRAIGFGVLDLAQAGRIPTWNEANPKAKRYVEAYKKLVGQN